MENTDIVKGIRLLRHLRGTTQAELARITGFSTVYVCSIEQGVRNPNEVFLRKMCRYFGLSRPRFLKFSKAIGPHSGKAICKEVVDNILETKIA